MVVASLDIAVTCPLAARCGLTDVMHPVAAAAAAAAVLPSVAVAAVASDGSQFRPLPLQHGGATSDSSASNNHVNSGDDCNGDDGGGDGDGDVTDLGRTGTTTTTTPSGAAQADTTRAIQTEVRSRRRTVAQIPCRTSAGATVALDLRLCGLCELCVPPTAITTATGTINATGLDDGVAVAVLSRMVTVVAPTPTA